MFDFNILRPEKRHIRHVELGAGAGREIPSRIAMDIAPGLGVDIVQDLAQPLPFDDNTISSFYSHHVLEHFNLHEFRALIREIYRCLVPGGRFSSRLPDMKAMCRQLADGHNVDDMILKIFGRTAIGQLPEPEHRHKYGWCKEPITEELKQAGFVIGSVREVGPNESIPVIDFDVRKP